MAEDLDLPQHVLRFWETRFTQIKPLKRGGGRRYYRPDDVELLRGIRHLLYGEGYTIKGVQRILKEQGPRFVMQIWREDAIPLAAASRMDEMEDEDGAAVPQPPQRRPQVVMQEPEPPRYGRPAERGSAARPSVETMIRVPRPGRARASGSWNGS
ncbi:MerR family transcriptional regulator [Pannonibacter sp. Pt2-lr]